MTKCTSKTHRSVAPKNPYADVNPKDILAATKMDLSIIPETLEAFSYPAWLEGALKYGRMNWRKKRVRMTVYISALERHTKKLKAGEWCDPKTKVPHLAYIVCCVGIMIDSFVMGTLVDDRPLANLRAAKFIDSVGPTIKSLNKIFAAENPHQYTIYESDDKSVQTVDSLINKMLGRSKRKQQRRKTVAPVKTPRCRVKAW